MRGAELFHRAGTTRLRRALRFRTGSRLPIAALTAPGSRDARATQAPHADGNSTFRIRHGVAGTISRSDLTIESCACGEPRRIRTRVSLDHRAETSRVRSRVYASPFPL